jgi:NADH:ubiquinone oxidoreductase subunit 5 (subunit L)/multisubunit Na+/H+ antiporter MnhA subunit
MHNLLNSIWLIPVVPLLASAWIALGYIFKFNRGEAGEAQTSRTALTASGISLLLILIQDVFALLYGAPGQLRFAPWLVSGDYTVFISFRLDALGLTMSTLVAFISFLIIKFSVNYMHRENGYQRYFIIMTLFNSAMLILMMAGSAVMALVGWKFAGVSSFLLIAYAFERDNATANANQAIITNRIGDAGFILAIILSYMWLGGVEWSDILKPDNGLSHLQIGFIAIGFIVAGLVKSAAVPFSPWITKALEGPTPSSAIFYGSLMVHAGLYLIIRIEPLLSQDPAILPLIFIMGFITTLYGFFSGLVQTDVKSILVFSVISQVGIILMLCGLDWFFAATLYMVAHSIWRAYQFLLAPSHMHLMSRPTRPVGKILQRNKILFTASIQRFWLDHIADWIMTKPAQRLARDARNFDEKIVNKITGMPSQARAISSLNQLETSNMVGKAQGVVGFVMQWLASIFGWFEDQLVLKTGSEGLMKIIRHLGAYVSQIETLLSQPRYLIILIVTTFVVIL